VYFTAFQPKIIYASPILAEDTFPRKQLKIKA